MVLLITQNTNKKKLFFLSFLRLKALFDCTLKLEKPKFPCGRKPNKHLSAHEKM